MFAKKLGTRGAFFALVSLLLLGAAVLSTEGFRPAKGYRAALFDLVTPGPIPPPPGLELLEDVRKRKQDFVADYFGLVYRGNTGNYIDAHVYYYGAYEKPELFLLRDTLAAIGPGAVVMDVGANTGLYSLFASKYAKTVHAVEPFPPILNRLRAAIAENKIGNIVVHPVGLGATEAKVDFFSPPEGNLGTGSFVPAYSEANRNEHLTLQIVPGDAYFQKAGIERVDFIKIDIEGYERPALAGLRRTLERHRPIVLLEITVRADLPELFKNLGELKAAFPENYEFLEMTARDDFTGAYRLKALQDRFDTDQIYAVARPAEKAALVPMSFDGRPAHKP